MAFDNLARQIQTHTIGSDFDLAGAMAAIEDLRQRGGRNASPEIATAQTGGVVDWLRAYLDHAAADPVLGRIGDRITELSRWASSRSYCARAPGRFAGSRRTSSIGPITRVCGVRNSWPRLTKKRVRSTRRRCVSDQEPMAAALRARCLRAADSTRLIRGPQSHAAAGIPCMHAGGHRCSVCTEPTHEHADGRSLL